MSSPRSSGRRSRLATKTTLADADDDREVLDLSVKRRDRPRIEIPSGRMLNTSPVSTPPMEAFRGESLSLGGQPVGLRKRVDSINLLKSLHGCNTLPDEDDEESSRGSPAYYSSRDLDSPLPRFNKMTRVDSKTLLHKMNNLNTYSVGDDEDYEEDDSPRKSKIMQLNEHYAKKGSAGAAAGRNSGRSSLWTDNVESTTYFESVQNKAPMLERRDSITLQQTMGGHNTVFGVHSESPRWKKVAALNKRRVARKMEEKRVEISKAASPTKIGLSLEDEEEEKEESKGDDGNWAAPRPSASRRSQPMDSIELHTQTSGVNTGTRTQHRSRVDSIQLQRSHGGYNTAETFAVVPGARDDEGKDSDDEDLPLRYFGRNKKGGDLSPRLVRVRQLNASLGRRDDSNLDLKEKDEAKANNSRRKSRAHRKSAPQISFT
mmetsp:Transcript_12428/g.24661  ORF Transcript_12428/g.24661 Transcript_12428/m.24661 type:complete len:432 (-) Transcript_12428:34-1329(-)